MTPAEFRAARLSLGLTQAQLAAVMGYAAYNRGSPPPQHRGWAT